MKITRLFAQRGAGKVGAAVAVVALAAAAAFGARLALADLTPKTVTNPYAALSDSQKAQQIAAARQQYEAHYAAWLASINVPKLNLGGLTRLPILAQYKPSKPTLAEALRNSDFVLGLSSVSFNTSSDSGSSITGTVTLVLKGTAPPTITVDEQGGLRPTPDWQGITLAEAENAPLLLPGEQAILFLTQQANGHYHIQSFSGMYRIVDGTVQALPGNAFASSVNGMTVDAFASLITQTLQAP